MHASGIVLPDLRMTTMTTAAEQFTAAEQLSELVATRRANMSTAMLRMASVSRAVGTKFCQWQNYANYEHTLYFWHNNINYVYYASKPGQPGFRRVIYIAVIINLILTTMQKIQGMFIICIIMQSVT